MALLRKAARRSPRAPAFSGPRETPPPRRRPLACLQGLTLHTAPSYDTPCADAIHGGGDYCGGRQRRVKIVETLHPAEIPHTYNVFSFRSTESFHVLSPCVVTRGTRAKQEVSGPGFSGPEPAGAARARPGARRIRAADQAPARPPRPGAAATGRPGWPPGGGKRPATYRAIFAGPKSVRPQDGDSVRGLRGDRPALALQGMLTKRLSLTAWSDCGGGVIRARSGLAFLGHD